MSCAARSRLPFGRREFRHVAWLARVVRREFRSKLSGFPGTVRRLSRRDQRMSSTTYDSGAARAPLHADPRRWKALAVLALIQFMLILDVTVVNVALPRIKDDLGFSRAGLAWVVNGYVLMAGGLLLLGGRGGDIFCPRKAFPLRGGLFSVPPA